MKITQEGCGPSQLIKGFSNQTEVAGTHFLVSVVELTPFVSISVCWFWD